MRASTGRARAVQLTGVMEVPTIDRFMTREPFSVSSTESLEQARTLMDQHAIHHLPVIDGDELVGIVEERELLVIESIPGLHPRSIKVGRVMKPPLSVSSNMPVDEALELMTEQRIDCAVVRTDARIVGIFTAVDALAALASLARRR